MNAIYTFANGNEYVGELEDGVPNGSGAENSVSGDKYVGNNKPLHSIRHVACTNVIQFPIAWSHLSVVGD